MRTWQIPTFGTLVRVERPIPEPGPGEVLVRVLAISLNYRDHLVVNGAYNPRFSLPLVPGSDCCGEIAAVGDGVDGALGTRVIVAFNPAWVSGPLTDDARDGPLGGPADGVFREYLTVSASAVVPAPAHLTDAQAACLPCAGVTAWRALVTDAGLTAGQTVLTLGTGGVSVFAVQLAVAMGARVAITSSSDDKLRLMRDLGVEHTVNYRTVAKWGRAVRDWRPCDVVVELGGAGTLNRSLDAVATGGHVALIGVLDGVKAEIALTKVLMRAVRIQGVFVGSVDDLVALCDFLVEHPHVRPVVDRTLPFDRADDALTQLATGGHVGKIVLTV